MANKIKYEHIHLTNFSKMRVDLAAEVSTIWILVVSKAKIYVLCAIFFCWACNSIVQQI